MESAKGGDISYLSELTPTPILVRGIALYKIGVGVKFAQTTYVVSLHKSWAHLK